jgi:hypothetical protein
MERICFGAVALQLKLREQMVLLPPPELKVSLVVAVDISWTAEA